MTRLPCHSSDSSAQCLLSGTLTLEWPAGTNSVIRKLGEACLKYNPAERPDFDTIATVLVKLEQHVKKEKKSKSLTETLWKAQTTAMDGAANAAAAATAAALAPQSSVQLSTSPGRTSPNHGLLAGGYVRERTSSGRPIGAPSPRTSASNNRTAPMLSAQTRNRSQSSSTRVAATASNPHPEQRLLSKSLSSHGRSSSYNGNVATCDYPIDAEALLRGVPSQRHSAKLPPVKTIKEVDPDSMFTRTSSPAAVSGGGGPKHRLSHDTQHLQTG